MSVDVLGIDARGDGVVVLTLRRPDKRNALDQRLRQALIDSLGALERDGEVSAVVLCGAGGTFCAGFDLDELMAADDQTALFTHSTTYHHAVHMFPKPLVAAVEGAAVAGGMDLAVMCDLRVVATDAKLGQPQVRLGVPAAFELMRTVMPESAARDLCLTGRIVDGTAAAAVGLVDRLVEPGEALDTAVALAADIAAVQGAATMKRTFLATQPNLFSGDTSVGDDV